MLRDPPSTLPPSNAEREPKRRRTALDRLREHRRRKAEGRARLVVEENLGLVADFLFEEGDLREDETEDREAVERALTRYLRKKIGPPPDPNETCFKNAQSDPS